MNGVMYVTAPDGVYALVPETGELLWKYDADPVALRGLAYWPGSAGSARAGVHGERTMPAGGRCDDRESRRRGSGTRGASI